MGKDKIQVYFKGAERFEIPEFTRVTVRTTCLLTNLVQELQVTRKGGSDLDMCMKEFGGTRLKIKLSLSTHVVTLLAPDYSWLPDAGYVAVIVANAMLKMFETRRTKRTMRLERSKVSI
jgi:hypothetical protein